VFICDECIDLCNEIIRDELPAADEAGRRRGDLPTPAEIKANLDNYVIGQEPPSARWPWRSTTTTSACATRKRPRRTMSSWPRATSC
jgi:hypothetical protein